MGIAGRGTLTATSALTPTPQRIVKTTPGGDSHFGPSAVHTGLPAYIHRRGNVLRHRRRVRGSTPATGPVAGATPLAEGSVWRSGQCVFTTRPPASRGRSSTSDPSGKGVQRHFEAAEYPPADRRPVGRAGIVRQGEVPMAPGSHLPKPRSTVHEGDPPTITANASIGKLWRVASTARPKPQLGRRQMSDCILAGWPVSCGPRRRLMIAFACDEPNERVIVGTAGLNQRHRTS